jgi:hypothetical protein
MTPGQALAGLRDELTAHGIATVGMTLTRHTGTPHLTHGPPIGYHAGLYWWPARRLNATRPSTPSMTPAIQPAQPPESLPPAQPQNRNEHA